MCGGYGNNGFPSIPGTLESTGFSWLTNARKGLVGGVWGLLAAVVLMLIDKAQQYGVTGTIAFTPDEQQLVILLVTPAVVWLAAQANNLVKNHPNIGGYIDLLRKFLP